MKRKLWLSIMAAVICLATPMPVNADVTGPDLYALYGSILEGYSDAYGEGQYNSQEDMLDGVCFVKLVDFNNDGNSEMLIAYENNLDVGPHGNYVFEIWAGVGDDVQMVNTGTLFCTNGNCQSLYLTKYGDQYYVVSGSADENVTYEYHGYAGEGYGVVHQAASVINNSTGQFDYTVDGASVTQEGWTLDQDSWQAECEKYKMNYSPSEEELQVTLDTISQIQSGNVQESMIASGDSDGTAVSYEDVGETVTAIEEEYERINQNVSDGTYVEIPLRDGVNGYYSQVDIKEAFYDEGVDGSPYTRYYYYNQGQLIFAYYEGTDVQMFYFSDGRMIRWISSMDRVNGECHDMEDSDEYRNWEKQVLDAGREFS